MTSRELSSADAAKARPRDSLPVLPEPPQLRADAARNREKLLAVAARMFERNGVEAVTLDDVVAAAGVGKGTLYRIFGDKSGLGAALLDDRERSLQREILSGRPPLGPGTAPARRLAAFVRAYTHYVTANLELVHMSQTSRPGARFGTGSHRFWRAHLVYLLEQDGATDSHLVADVLLAAMTAEQIHYWTQVERRDVKEIVHQLVTISTHLMARHVVMPRKQIDS